MPITQDRLINLINTTDLVLNAALTARKKLSDAHELNKKQELKQATDISSNPQANTDDIRGAMQIVINVYNGFVEMALRELPVPLESLINLTRERTRFEIRRDTNSKSARAMKSLRQRRKQDPDQRDSPPLTRAGYERWNRGDFEIKEEVTSIVHPPISEEAVLSQYQDLDQEEIEHIERQDKERKAREKDELEAFNKSGGVLYAGSRLPR